MSTIDTLSSPSAAEDEATLLALIRTRSFRRGRFKLASGVDSDLYFNLKPTMMDPRGAYLAARAFIDRILPENVDYVGGLEMGAVPIIGALAAVSHNEGRPIRTFFQRKSVKEYGAQLAIEGLGPDESLAGKRVLVLDDVATSGGSLIKTIDAARAAGAYVDAALVLVDRQEGASETLAKLGIRLLSVFKASQFM